MREERLMEHLKEKTGSDGQVCAAITKLLYEYAYDVNCPGVVFKRLSKINEGSIKVQGSEEPLHVYEGEETENVCFTYVAPVVADAWELTNRQLEDALARLQGLELVKCFQLENPEGNAEYSLKLKDLGMEGVADGKICAYALTPEAMELLEESI